MKSVYVTKGEVKFAKEGGKKESSKFPSSLLELIHLASEIVFTVARVDVMEGLFFCSTTVKQGKCQVSMSIVLFFCFSKLSCIYLLYQTGFLWKSLVHCSRAQVSPELRW